MPPHPTSWRSILILSSHLCLGLNKWSLSFTFPPPKPCLHLSFPHTCYMPRPSHYYWFDHLNDICWAVQMVYLQVLWTAWWWPTYKAETCSCILHIAPIWYCCVYWLYVYIDIHTHYILCITVYFLSMLSSPLPSHLISLRPIYFSHHSVPKHPQPAFYFQCQRPQVCYLRRQILCLNP